MKATQEHSFGRPGHGFTKLKFVTGSDYGPTSKIVR